MQRIKKGNKTTDLRAVHIGYTVEKRENNVYIQIEIYGW